MVGIRMPRILNLGLRAHNLSNRSRWPCTQRPKKDATEGDTEGCVYGGGPARPDSSPVPLVSVTCREVHLLTLDVWIKTIYACRVVS